MKKTSKKRNKKSGNKKPAGKTVKPAKLIAAKPIGVVTHFYSSIKVGIFKFKKPVKSGTEIRIKGATTDFKAKISSMQYDHKTIKIAPKGKQIGIKLSKRVRVGDLAYPVK